MRSTCSVFFDTEVEVNTVVSGLTLGSKGGSGPTLFPKVKGLTPPQSLPVHPYSLKIGTAYYFSRGWDVTLPSGPPLKS